ncbi:alpha/beta hydrolase fold domain-containing protein [Streptomyces sp. NPDC056296]|uniref:alpha/beta hydrolase fold domain-containing protein n=1 Tax=Streptomyces sp. NPDC056296 TaxID=3345775 RepID=UPI0035DBB30F
MSDVHDHPPIDRDLAETAWPALLEKKKATHRLTAEEYQAHVKATVDWWPADLERGGAVEVTETTIESASGDQRLPVLILKPSSGSGPFPCLYYTANGGKMLQSTTMALTDVESRWVEELGVAVVSIAPRVGPQYPHPAQVEDAYAGLRWLVENAESLDIDPGRVIVYGKSGGGGIAAATALYARDRGGPHLAHQMLICPMIDDRPDNASSHYDVAPWTAANNRVGWSAILGDAAGGPEVSPYAAAARATDLGGLPPAYLEVGSSEVFRDETLDYASRLARAGVPMEVHSWAGGFHSFEISAPDANVSRACLAARTSYLERALKG